MLVCYLVWRLARVSLVEVELGCFLKWADGFLNCRCMRTLCSCAPERPNTLSGSTVFVPSSWILQFALSYQPLIVLCWCWSLSSAVRLSPRDGYSIVDRPAHQWINRATLNPHRPVSRLVHFRSLSACCFTVYWTSSD